MMKKLVACVAIEVPYLWISVGVALAIALVVIGVEHPGSVCRDCAGAPTPEMDRVNPFLCLFQRTVTGSWRVACEKLGFKSGLYGLS